MADRHAASITVGPRLADDLVKVHPAGVEVEIQVEVDVEVELLRDGEDAGDLLDGVAVRIGAAADQVGALPAGRDQQLLGAWIVKEALLREYADLDIDCPGV